MLRNWDDPAFFKDRTSYETFRDIKGRVEAGGKRVWAREPPWKERSGGGGGHEGGYVGWGNGRSGGGGRHVEEYGYSAGSRSNGDGYPHGTQYDDESVNGYR